MGGRLGWALDAFWFKTNTGGYGIYGNAAGGWEGACDTSEATNPMFIGVGMQDHIDTIWWDCMQAIWCHYVDLDDFNKLY